MQYNLYNKLLLQLRCNDLDSTIKASTCTTSKYYSYMFYADRNVRPCTILGCTLTTYPKSLIHTENNKKNHTHSTELRAVEGPCMRAASPVVIFHCPSPFTQKSFSSVYSISFPHGHDTKSLLVAGINQ